MASASLLVAVSNAALAARHKVKLPPPPPPEPLTLVVISWFAVVSLLPVMIIWVLVQSRAAAKESAAAMMLQRKWKQASAVKDKNEALSAAKLVQRSDLNSWGKRQISNYVHGRL